VKAAVVVARFRARNRFRHASGPGSQDAGASAAVERGETPALLGRRRCTNAFIPDLPKINQSPHQSGLLFTVIINQAK
jgi:hypothetical protein